MESSSAEDVFYVASPPPDPVGDRADDVSVAGSTSEGAPGRERPKSKSPASHQEVGEKVERDSFSGLHRTLSHTEAQRQALEIGCYVLLLNSGTFFHVASCL